MSEPNSTQTAVSTRADGVRQAYILQRISAEVQKRLHKTTLGLMNETINPLWNIDAKQAQLIYDFARSGNYAQIQYLYEEIEQKDPTLGVCVTRRTSAVAELDWRVVRSDQRLNRNVDQSLVDEQIEFVETAMAKIDNMPDALEHLALSAFRGFSVVAPVHSYTGDISHFDLIDGWNLCLDRLQNQWLFNPSASSFFMPTNYQMATTSSYHDANANLQRIPPEQICAVTRKREIDWPAMQIYLRCTIGERDWGRFLETYGLPPVIITMPEFTSKEDQEAYIAAAQAVFEGRSGVVPHDSQVNYASESRGTNPFTEFIEHQQKLIVMMATGGTLATLSEATGIGGGASDVQQDEWKRIIRADKRIISNAINKQICERLIRSCRDFKGKPILAEFQLDDTPKPTPKEMLDLASAAASAGFEMDADELSQAIGYKLTKKVEGGGGFGGIDLGSSGGGHDAPAPDPNGTDEGSSDDAGEQVVQNVQQPSGVDRGEFAKLCKVVGDIANRLNVQVEPIAVSPATELEPMADNSATDAPAAAPVHTVKPKSNPAPEKERKPTGAVNAAVAEELAKSLQTDFQPVADRLVQILALPENERAGAAVTLLKEIDRLVPEDPAMAKVIAEQMKEVFDRQVGTES